MSLISAPTSPLRARANFGSRRRTTYTLVPASPSAARAPSSGTRSVAGSAMKVAVCSALAVRIFRQSSAGPETATTLLPESTAQASTPAASHERRRNGGSASLCPSAVRRCSVGLSASARAVASASSPMRRRSSRAVVAASCTRALPCSSARSCSMPLAYQEIPPPTSSTRPRWITTSHQPRLVRAGSGHSVLHRCARRARMALSAAGNRCARPGS